MRTSGPCPSTLNIRVSSQGSGVILANHIVTTDSNSGRSRIDNYRTSHGGKRGNATGSRQSHDSSILVGGDVVGGGVNILTEGGLSSTLNQFTISVPSIDGAFSISRIDGSSNSNLSAIANGDGVFAINSNVGNNRDRINSNQNLIAVEAQSMSLNHAYTNSSGLSIVSSIGRQSSTRNIIMISSSIYVPNIITIGSVTDSHGILLLSNLIPLISEIISVVIIIQVSSEGHFAIRTDLSFRSSDVYNRLLIDPNEELLRHGRTTGRNVISFNINSKSVRFDTSIEILLIELVVTKVISHVVSDLTRLIPSVVQVAYVSTDGVNISNQHDRHGNTDVLIASDLNGRVRVNRQSRRRNCSRLTTGSGQSNNSSIDELLCIVVNSHRAVIDGGSSSTRNEDTISIPSVNRSAKRSIVLSNIGSNLNLSALTSNIGRERDIVDNRISMYSNIESGAGSSTTRGELLNAEGVAVITNGRNNSVGQRGSTSNQVAIVIPLIY